MEGQKHTPGDTIDSPQIVLQNLGQLIFDNFVKKIQLEKIFFSVAGAGSIGCQHATEMNLNYY